VLQALTALNVRSNLESHPGAASLQIRQPRYFAGMVSGLSCLLMGLSSLWQRQYHTSNDTPFMYCRYEDSSMSKAAALTCFNFKALFEGQSVQMLGRVNDSVFDRYLALQVIGLCCQTS